MVSKFRMTPRMAKVGQTTLVDLGYESVEFGDAQKVFFAMLDAMQGADVLWCESCGESEQQVKTEFAGLCSGCWSGQGMPR